MEDHFIFIFTVCPLRPNISTVLKELEQMIQRIEDLCGGYSFNPKFGLLTARPLYSGSALSVVA